MLLAYINAGGETAYLGFQFGHPDIHLFLIGTHLDQQAFHHLFHRLE
jgi:hypothetical protein